MRKGFRIGAAAGSGIKRGARAVGRGAKSLGRGFIFGLRRNPAQLCNGCRRRNATYGVVTAGGDFTRRCAPCIKNPEPDLLKSLGITAPRPSRKRAAPPAAAQIAPATTPTAPNGPFSKKVFVTKGGGVFTARTRRGARKKGKKYGGGRITQLPVYNPAGSGAKEVFETFHGRPSLRWEDGWSSSKRAPRHLGELGGLRKITLRGGKVYSFSPTKAKLTADKRGNLWLAGVRFPKPKEIRNPAEAGLVGQIQQIEYLTNKTHMEGRPTIYFHDFEGTLPLLFLDHEGFPVIDGGTYRIKEEGIIG